MKPSKLDARQLRPCSSIDLLDLPFEGGGLEREGNVFKVLEPWALARYGEQLLAPGWWLLECEGDANAAPEVRLSTAEQPFLAIGSSHATNMAGSMRLFFRQPTPTDVVVLVSAWPQTVQFRKLCLRRLTTLETIKLLSESMRRLSKRRNPINRVAHIAARVMTGAPLRFDVAAAPTDSFPLAEKVRGETAKIVPHVRSVQRRGEMTLCLHADDLLHPRALEIVNDAFGRRRDLVAIYTDVNEGGEISPTPEWEPELARSCDFSHLPLFVSDRFKSDGRWLTIAEIVDTAGPHAIARIALPLASRPAVVARSVWPADPPRLRNRPRVSIIIPTKTRIDLLERCLAGLASQTDYPEIQVVIVDNGSTDPTLPKVIERASQVLDIQVIRDIEGFNFSRLVNRGARIAKGEILLLLNDDVEPIEKGWLDRMVQSCLDPAVGAVGARLLYPDMTIQHAGVVLGVGGVAGHLWRGADAARALSLPQIVSPGSRRAVTGACLALRRAAFESVGGMDETFAVALNDIDLCMRLNAIGLRTAYRGDAVLIHHESQSRGSDDATRQKRVRLAFEHSLFLSRWRRELRDDPHGSPALDLAVETGTPHRAAFGS